MQNQQIKENKMSISWDEYFFKICEVAAMKSHCLSRQIGAVLVRDKTVISVGYNGPPRGIPHCGVERKKSDVKIFHRLSNTIDPVFGDDSMCPRQRLGFSSGDGLEMCPAAHAEDNCISNAARVGVVVEGSTMYVSCGVPCKDCLKKIINAGIMEIVCKTREVYDDMTLWLLNNSELIVRYMEAKDEDINNL